jgi:phosphoribosylglycinamide formyltransferase-1
MNQQIKQKFNIAFFASHGGTNMQAIIDACKSGFLQSKPSLIISNNSESGAIKRAIHENIPFFHISSKTHPLDNERTKQIIQYLIDFDINMIVLAGYMKKLETEIIEKVNGLVLNIHPALLPKFGGENMYGINVHKAVIAAGVTKSGATVHLVDSEYDKGRILLQSEVPVLYDDTPETLAERVLKTEHLIYPKAIKMLETEEISL